MAETIFIHTNPLYKRFITLPGEELLLATRTHWIRLLPSIFILFIFIVSLHIGTFIGFIVITRQLLLYILGTLVITIFALALITKIITEWYFHMYIISNKKILELSYTLLFSYSINDVLLDQVRCTEIDTQMNGFIDRFFDKGTVSITFDRPTHQEEFHLCDIPEPEKTGILLSDAFDRIRHSDGNIWVRTKNGGYRFTEEIQNEPTRYQSGGDGMWRYQ